MFGWFRRREAPRFADPDLGEMRLEHGSWHCQLELPAIGSVEVSAPDAGGRPPQGLHAAVQEFCRRYPELRPALALELRRAVGCWLRWRSCA
jgi:hypothetical protein